VITTATEFLQTLESALLAAGWRGRLLLAPMRHDAAGLTCSRLGARAVRVLGRDGGGPVCSSRKADDVAAALDVAAQVRRCVLLTEVFERCDGGG
jgi:hypothetical protein